MMIIYTADRLEWKILDRLEMVHMREAKQDHKPHSDKRLGWVPVSKPSTRAWSTVLAGTGELLCSSG